MKTVIQIASKALRRGDVREELQFVPPTMRKRLSPLQRMAFAALRAVDAPGLSPQVFFASAFGEQKLACELVEMFTSMGDVSPWKFSSSVYNAAPGLYSVVTGNHSGYTAIAAGEETVENSLFEAVFAQGPRIWCCAEECGDGYAAALRLACADDPCEGESVRVDIGAGGGQPIEFDAMARFIAGEVDVLNGRHLLLERISCVL